MSDGAIFHIWLAHSALKAYRSLYVHKAPLVIDRTYKGCMFVWWA